MSRGDIFGKVTRMLVENGNITREEEAVYQYAMKSMLILGGNILISILIGICMGVPGYCILFLGALVPLRSDAGGYHAPSLFVCYMLSFATLVVTLAWMNGERIWQLAVIGAAALLSSIWIYRYAPLESRNKPLEATEKKNVRKRARRIVLLEMTAGCLLVWADRKAACCIWSAMIWCAAGYGAWFIEKKVYEKKKLTNERGREKNDEE